MKTDKNFSVSSFQMHARILLEGDELESYRSAEEEARQLIRDEAAKARAVLARSRRRIEADEGDESDSDSDSDEEGAGTGDGALGEFAEPGSSMRKRKHQVAFEEVGELQGDGLKQSDESNNVSFDIYLKGNASRATSFFGKSAGMGSQHGAGSRFRMFPFFERKKRIDAFGEVIDVGRWKAKRGEMDADGDGVEGNRSGPGLDANAALLNESNPINSYDQALEKRRDAREKKKLEAPPSKFVEEKLEVSFSCQLFFVDMSGLNDGRALKTLIPQLHPRRLIAVNANEITRNDMLSTLSSIKSMTSDLHFPSLGEVVKIGQITSSFTVNLSDAILAGLKLSKYEDFEVAQIRGTLKENEDEKDSVPMLELIRKRIAELPSQSELSTMVASSEDVGEKGNLVPSGDQSSYKKPALPPTIFIGDLKLSNLKTVLASRHKVTSEFAGEGMLVCGTGGNEAKDGSGASVTVQKESKGRVVIEGNVARGFYKVRDAVYSMHASV